MDTPPPLFLLVLLLLGGFGAAAMLSGPDSRAAGSSRGFKLLAVLPGVVMLGLFYSLAVHMHRSLGGWPSTIGNEKYHQSFGVSMGNPLLGLLKRNFPGLSELKPSHDVNPGELPIRDLGDFFRTWLKETLSEDLQEKRVRKAPGIEDASTLGAEQGGRQSP